MLSAFHYLLMFRLNFLRLNWFTCSVYPAAPISSSLPRRPCRMRASSLIWKMSPACRSPLDCLCAARFCHAFMSFSLPTSVTLAAMKELRVINRNAEKWEFNQKKKKNPHTTYCFDWLIWDEIDFLMRLRCHVTATPLVGFMYVSSLPLCCKLSNKSQNA